VPYNRRDERRPQTSTPLVPPRRANADDRDDDPHRLACCDLNGIRQRAKAVAVIESVGGHVEYDFRSHDGTYWPNAVPPGPAWLRRFLGENYLANVVEVQLFADRDMEPDKITDPEASQLAALTEAKWFVLMDTGITDAGLKHFKRLRKLERLDLEGSLVTEAGARELHRALPRLRISFTDGLIDP
jgi:hypothetical protein